MKKLFEYLKEYRFGAVLAPLFKMLEAFLDLLVPLVVARIIDSGIAKNDRAAITRDIILMLALALTGLIISVTAQWFAAKAAIGTVGRMRQGLFDHIQRLSFSELDRLGGDTLITRMTSDMNQIQNGLNTALRLLLRSPIVVIGAMIMAFTIDVRCALIFVVTIPVLSLIVFGIMLISIPLFQKVQKSLDRVLGITRENLTGVRVVRAFRKEKDEIRGFDESNETLTKISLFVGRLSALINPLTFFLINYATIRLIETGALRVELGRMAQGDVVALYNYMAQMIIELLKIAILTSSMNRAVACSKRVQEIFAVEPDMVYPQETAPADGMTDEAVVFDHVSFSYRGAGAPALTDISFAAKRGETIGIIGGTGSGKSSLVNLISRFYDVSDGAVRVCGRDVRTYERGALGSLLGIVPQKAQLFQGSIRDNLKWGNETASDEELMEAVRTAQAEDVVAAKPGSLDFLLEQNGQNLSGGQKQRLTIARALVRKPEILILDDSASALDFATDAKLRHALRSLPGSMTVFVVSQRTASIRFSDKILVLDNGELIGTGTHDELMNSCSVYREIFYSQFPEERPAAPSPQTAKKEVLA